MQNAQRRELNRGGEPHSQDATVSLVRRNTIHRTRHCRLVTVNECAIPPLVSTYIEQWMVQPRVSEVQVTRRNVSVMCETDAGETLLVDLDYHAFTTTLYALPSVATLRRKWVTVDPSLSTALERADDAIWSN